LLPAERGEDAKNMNMRVHSTITEATPGCDSIFCQKARPDCEDEMFFEPDLLAGDNIVHVVLSAATPELLIFFWKTVFYFSKVQQIRQSFLLGYSVTQ
jgi:hypothetical protein